MFNRHDGNTSTLAVVMVVIVLGLIVLWLVNSNDETAQLKETKPTEQSLTTDTGIQGTAETVITE